MKTWKLLCLPCLVCLAWAASAQEEDQLLLQGVPLENAVVGRDLALRLRLEAQFSDDDDELIDDDINYARFPSRTYSAEAKVYQSDQFNAGLQYQRLSSEQGADIGRWYAKLQVPMGEGNRSHLTFKFRRQLNEDTADANQAYIGFGHYSAGDVYSFVEYRQASYGGQAAGHRLYEYVSWKLTRKLRVGEQGAVTKNEGEAAPYPWYTELFSTIFLLEDLTSLRMDARYYASDEAFAYQEYNAYLYQKIGSRSLLRLNYRFYHDDEGLQSCAWGVKAKRYFSPRFSAHVGYRLYDHNEGPDFGTVYAGIGLLL